MINNKISSLQLSILSIFLFNAFFTTGLFTYILEMNTTSIMLTIILGSLIGYLLLKLFLYLTTLITNTNIFESIQKETPKLLGPLLNVLLILSSLLIGIYTLHNISLFVNNTLLNDISILPISTLFTLAALYLSSKGIKTIVTASGIFIFIAIIMNIIIGATVITYVNPENLYPITMDTSISILSKGLSYALVIIAPLFLLLVIPFKRIDNINKYKKYQKIFYIAGSIYIIFKVLLILSILGIPYTNILNYPEINILKKVSLLNFIERIEDNTLTNILINNFIMLSFIMYYIRKGISITFGIKKENKLLLPVLGILIIILSNYFKITDFNYLLYALITIVIVSLIASLMIKNKHVD